MHNSTNSNIPQVFRNFILILPMLRLLSSKDKDAKIFLNPVMLVFIG